MDGSVRYEGSTARSSGRMIAGFAEYETHMEGYLSPSIALRRSQSDRSLTLLPSVPGARITLLLPIETAIGLRIIFTMLRSWSRW